MIETVSDLDHAFSVVDALHDCRITDRVQEERVFEALGRAGIESVLRKAMQSKDWGLRYKCLTTIHDLGWPVFFDALVEHAKQETNTRAHINCLYACAGVLNTPAQFLRLYNATDAMNVITTGFAEGVFRKALRRLRRFCEPETVREMLGRCIRRPPSPSLASLILSIGKEQMREFAPMLIERARARPDRIVVISAMRALYFMELSDDLIVEKLSSKDTVILIAAIRSSTYCGDAVEQKLASLMTSHSFDVRYAAAMTLRTFGSRGISTLREVHEKVDDPYAKSMAKFGLMTE
jgi:hypothetical protein